MQIGLCIKGWWSTSAHTLVVITGKDKWEQYKHHQIRQLLDGDVPPLEGDHCDLEEVAEGKESIQLMKVRRL